MTPLDRLPRWTRVTAVLCAVVVYETAILVAVSQEGFEAALVVAWAAPIAAVVALATHEVVRHHGHHHHHRH